MRKLRIYRILLWFMASVVLLFTTLVLVIWLNRDEICSMAIKEANKYLKVKVEVSSVELEFFSTFPQLSVDFNNVFIADDIDSLNRDTLLQTERIRCRFNPLDLWNENYEVKSVEVSPGTLKMRIDESGNTNYAIFKSAEEQGEDSDFEFKLKTLVLDKMRLSYRNDANRQFYSTSIKRLALTGNFDQSSFELKTLGKLQINEATSGTVSLVKNQPAELNLSLNVNLDSGSFTIPNSTIYVSDLPFNFSGHYDSTSFAFDISGKNLKVDEVANKLAFDQTKNVKNLNGTGSVRFDLKISGDSKRTSTPIVNCAFGVKNASLEDSQKHLKMNAINIDGSYINEGDPTHESLKLNNVSFNTGLGKFSGELSIRNFLSPVYSGSVNGNVDLAILQSIFHYPGISFIDGSVALASSFSVEERINPEGGSNYHFRQMIGTADLNNVELQLTDDQRQFKGINGKVALRGNEVGVEELEVKLGQSDLKVTGLLQGLSEYLNGSAPARISAEVISKRIRLEDLTSESKEVKQQGTRTYLLPNDIAGNVLVNIHSLEYEGHNFDNCLGELSIENRQIDLSRFSFVNAGANVAGGIQIVEERPEILTISGTVASNNIEFDKLFKEWDNFNQSVLGSKNIEGTAQLNLQLKAPFDFRSGIIKNAVEAQIGIRILNGKLKDVGAFNDIIASLNETPSAKLVIGKDNIKAFGQKLKNLSFKQLENTLVIRNSVLTIPQMSIESSALDMELSGKHTFDNVIDYRIGFRYRDLKQKETSEFGEIVDDGTGKMIFLRMYGNLDDPTIEWDKESNKERRKQDKELAVNDAKSILKSEFGLFKKDTTVREYVREKFKREEINIEFNPVEGNDTLLDQKPVKDGKAKQWFNKLKQESKGAKKEEFEIDL